MRRQLDIVDAARDITLTHGAHAVTMASIAEQTGLSRSAIYQYFSSRGHILGELILSDMADLCHSLDDLLASQSDPAEKVRLWVHYCFAFLCDPEHATIQSIAKDLLPETQLSIIGSLHGVFIAPLSNALEELGEHTPESTSYMIYGALHQAAQKVDSHADFLAEAHALEKFALAFLSGYDK